VIERAEDDLREHGQYPQGTTLRAARLLALADLIAAARKVTRYKQRMQYVSWQSGKDFDDLQEALARVDRGWS